MKMDVCGGGYYEKSLDSLSQSTLFSVGKESLQSLHGEVLRSILLTH